MLCGIENQASGTTKV